MTDNKPHTDLTLEAIMKTNEGLKHEVVNNIHNYHLYQNYTITKVNTDIGHIETLLAGEEENKDELLKAAKNFQRLRVVFEKGLKMPLSRPVKKPKEEKPKPKEETPKKKTEREKLNERIDEESMNVLKSCNINKESFLSYLENKLEMFQEKTETVDVKNEVLKFGDEYTRFLSRKQKKNNSFMGTDRTTKSIIHNSVNNSFTQMSKSSVSFRLRNKSQNHQMTSPKQKTHAYTPKREDSIDVNGVTTSFMISSSAILRPVIPPLQKLASLPAPPVFSNAANRLAPLQASQKRSKVLSIKLDFKNGIDKTFDEKPMKATEQQGNQDQTPMSAVHLSKQNTQRSESFDQKCANGEQDITFRTEESMSIGNLESSLKSSGVYTTVLDSKNNSENGLANCLIYKGKLNKLNCLGDGAEAKVFLVELQDDENKLIVLKEYECARQKQSDEKILENIINEYRVLKSLNHPRILKYWSLFKPQKSKHTNMIKFGILMEYMEGGSLEEYIAAKVNEITMEQKKELMRQILQGLLYLHENKMIHRDLKPGNILLNKDKTEIKITDFGISTVIQENISIRRSFVGTPYYMAPEVILEQPYSTKADIWSAACCFFHLVFGEKPYHGHTQMQAIIRMIQDSTPLDTLTKEQSQLMESVEGLDDFMRKCFEKEKSKRWTAAALLGHEFLKPSPVPN